MGKRSKSCNSAKVLKKVAKDHTYDNEISKTKSQLFEEPLQNKVRNSKKNKRHTHSNEPVKHKLKLEKNIEIEETGPVELSPPAKKIKTNKKSKTCINKETDKSVFGKNIIAVETENIEVEDIEPTELSSYTKKVKTNKKTETRVIQDDVETNAATVESEAGDLLTDLSKNKNKTKKKNNGKLLKESKTAGTDNEARKIDKQTVKPRKLKNTQLIQEDEVKDEDIDKFCEELSEEDNVHYNIWVELLEAKLSSNKKKPK